MPDQNGWSGAGSNRRPSAFQKAGSLVSVGFLVVTKYAYGVSRGGWCATGAAGLLIAGVLAWRTWPHTSAGSFDPVSAVIGIASLVVGIAALILAARAQRQADTDVATAARRLAVAVGEEETKARQQLLGGDDRTINVRYTFQPAPGQAAAGAGCTGTLEHIVSYYRKLQPHRMVITGAPGSGKTVLAIELMLGLLKDRSADAPVPVRMSAASLDTSRPARSAIAECITEHLTQAYRMPEAAARELVAARMVLPVLDGLDEMDSAEAPAYASRAGQAIRACNAYLDGQEKAAMVLTCRISQYEALEQAREWVRDAARIQVLPVAVPAARRFLTARVIDKSRWQPILERMQQPGNPPLAQAMSTPWRLTVAATVYDQRDPATGRYLRDTADLISPAMDTEERIRDHLLGLYILAAITAHDSPYPADCVQHWLAVLASYLHTNTASATRPAPVIAGRTLSGTDLVLHELWPLAGYRLPRIITAGVMAIIGLSNFTLGLLESVWAGFTWRVTIILILDAIIVVSVTPYGLTAWNNPARIDLQRMKTRSGLNRAALGVALGVAFGVAFGVGVGVAGGLVFGSSVDTDEYSAIEPKEILRKDLITGVVFGVAFGVGVVAGVVAGVAAGVVFGVLDVRYIALLLCTRRWTAHWLPWRLGKFTQWCYQSGLFRIAGIGYQFRHKELLDYLTRDSASLVRLRPVQTP